MPFETIVCEKNDGVGTITLNRPEKMNAINPEMITELGDAIADLSIDDDVRAVVLRGNGKGFCAGADVGGTPGAQGRAATVGAEAIRRAFRGAPHISHFSAWYAG